MPFLWFHDFDQGDGTHDLDPVNWARTVTMQRESTGTLRWRNVMCLALVCCLGLTACAVGGARQGTAGIHARLGYTEESGLRVVEVPQGSPSEEAGLQVGDHITEIDGDAVRNLNYDDLVGRLRGSPGSTIRLTVVRQGQSQTLKVRRKPYKRQ